MAYGYKYTETVNVPSEKFEIKLNRNGTISGGQSLETTRYQSGSSYTSKYIPISDSEGFLYYPTGYGKTVTIGDTGTINYSEVYKSSNVHFIESRDKSCLYGYDITTTYAYLYKYVKETRNIVKTSKYFRLGGRLTEQNARPAYFYLNDDVFPRVVYAVGRAIYYACPNIKDESGSYNAEDFYTKELTNQATNAITHTSRVVHLYDNILLLFYVRREGTATASPAYLCAKPISVSNTDMFCGEELIVATDINDFNINQSNTTYLNVQRNHTAPIRAISDTGTGGYAFSSAVYTASTPTFSTLKYCTFYSVFLNDLSNSVKKSGKCYVTYLNTAGKLCFTAVGI